MFGAGVPPYCLEPILLLKQGDGDDDMMLRTETQKKRPIFVAVANSVSIYDSVLQFERSSHSCVEVS